MLRHSNDSSLTEQARLLEADIEAVKRRTPIEKLAFERRLKLNRVGCEWIGPCPICGGHDRFSLSIKKQAWNCRGCGIGGDVIALLRHLDRCDFPTAMAALAGAPPPRAYTNDPESADDIDDPQSDDNTKRRLRALRIWHEAVDLAGTPALSYLIRPRTQGGRGVVLPEGVSPRVLRFHPRHYWRSDAGELICGPALIALYRDIKTDEPTAIWRRPLTSDGRSAGKPKAMGLKGGAAIKLCADEDVEQGLHIGEGLETMLAATMCGFAPAWACGDTGNLSRFPVLAGIDALTIIVDNDAKGDGQRAAANCFDTWVKERREVFVVTPNAVGADMNDIVGGRS